MAKQQLELRARLLLAISFRGLLHPGKGQKKLAATRCLCLRLVTVLSSGTLHTRTETVSVHGLRTCTHQPCTDGKRVFRFDPLPYRTYGKVPGSIDTQWIRTYVIWHPEPYKPVLRQSFRDWLTCNYYSIPGGCGISFHCYSTP